MVAVSVLVVSANLAMADGMIVPVDPELRVRGAWAVKYHRVDITVRDQVAQVTVDQAFVNTGRRAIEVEYLFPIPPDAAITAMTLLADGQELPGKLMDADEARRIYEDIVRRKKDPALLEYVGYGLYKTHVFPLPPGEQRRVLVNYTVPCPKDGDLVRVHYPLNTEKFSARPIKDVRVTVDIHNARPIGPVYSPTHELTTERHSPTHVTATYQVADAIPATDFELVYQDGSGDIGATVVSYRPDGEDDGYAMALVSPTAPRAATVEPKDIVFVIDQSGSMRGAKIDQAREALVWVLENLNPADRFNVVAFSSSVRALFTDALVAADADHTARAVELVKQLQSGGGTNIAGALREALSRLPAGSERPAYVVFLTDGLPTAGETTEIDELVKLSTDANTAGARLMTLGVGYDVNTRLLDLLSQTHRGFSEYVKPNESLEAKVSGLYTKIRNPVMTDVAVTLDGAGLNRVYPGEVGDLFDGGQIMMVGRYTTGGDATLRVSGTCRGERRVVEYPVRLDVRSEDTGRAYLPRVWAMRRVGYLMDQIALHGENNELIDELVALSKAYGIMTPYTSFLADETVDLADAEAVRDRGRSVLSTGLKADTGWKGQQNAKVRQELRRATNAPAPTLAVRADGGTSAPASAVLGGGSSRDAYEGDGQAVTNVITVANQTLYRRGRQWFTPDLAEVDVDDPDADVVTLRQFDDRYFALARRSDAAFNAVLATQRPGDELLVTLDGQVYRILPAE
ncbi:MAG: VIT domain-containing protein [Planctomycetota bacterium]